MSLAKAVLKIADRIEKDLESYKADVPGNRVKSYVQLLRIAVDASEDNDPPSDFKRTDNKLEEELHHRSTHHSTNQLLTTAATQDTVQELLTQLATKQAKREELTAETMALCVGGSHDGDMNPMAPGIPIGAYIPLEDTREVYQLVNKGGSLLLEYNEVQTQRYRGG